MNAYVEIMFRKGCANPQIKSSTLQTLWNYVKFTVLGIFDTEHDEREHRTISNIQYEKLDLFQISRNGSQDISCPRVGNICENFTFND